VLSCYFDEFSNLFQQIFSIALGKELGTVKLDNRSVAYI